MARLKKVSILLFSLFIFFSLNKVQANTINEITMDVFLDKNGNAIINEEWDAKLDRGTEGYRSFKKFRVHNRILNFSVRDDSGKKYILLNNWDEKASFEEKAYKCGVLSDFSKTELCWGISKYGNRRYKLEYTISNLVEQYDKTQGLYFNFLNIDQRVGKATITIHSDTPFMKKIRKFGD